MSIHRLKTSKPEAEKKEDDEKVRSTVESILADVEERGDASVRELSMVALETTLYTTLMRLKQHATLFYLKALVQVMRVD